MCFVGDHGEGLSLESLVFSDRLHREGEGLDGHDDDEFAVGQCLGKQPRLRCTRLGCLVAVDRDDDALIVVDLLDRILQLRVEDVAIGHHDDRVEHLLIVHLQPRHPVCCPGDRVGLTRSGRMLNQIPLSGALSGDRSGEVGDRLPLVKAREPQRRGFRSLAADRIRL